MHANKVTFSELLGGAKQFQVPAYQRTFAWTERQAGQLWTDICNEANRRKQGLPSGHFLGSIVLAPSPTFNAGPVSEWVIVDGQQRLTTLMLALVAMRDHLEGQDSELQQNIEKTYLVNSTSDHAKRLKLRPSQQDRESFESVMLKLGSNSPHAGDKVRAVYRFFRKALTELNGQSHGVAHIEDAVRHSLEFVQIVASQNDNAHRIYQTLNSTGLRLTQTDLVRNHLFMLLPNRIDEIYHDRWLPMQRRIKDDGIEILLWLDLILRGQDSAPQSDVFRLQAERFGRLSGEDFVAAEIKGLERRSHCLHRILDPSQESNNKLRHRLGSLREWGSPTVYPVIMLVLELLDRELMTTDDAVRSLLYVESFCVRRAIAGIPGNSLGRIMNAVPREIGASVSFAEDLHRYLSGPKKFWPDDARLADAIQTHPFYLSSRGPQRTFILRRFEESLRQDEVVDWEKSEQFTVEHVMPQSLSGDWMRDLDSEAERFGITVNELHKLVVHTLGNLTLTTKNSPLSNSSFAVKKPILKRSALAMNQEIVSVPNWNGLTIADRGQRLAKTAIEIWPAPIAHSGGSEGRDWTLLYEALRSIPEGRWTTFADLAEVVGSHPVSVSSHLASRSVDPMWRVLMTEGTPSPQLAARLAGKQRSRLEDEGVVFTMTGQASPAQKLDADAILKLMGKARHVTKQI